MEKPVLSLHRSETVPDLNTKKMENQNLGFNYIFFTSYNGNVDFVYNHFNNRFDQSDQIDFTDNWKYKISGKLVSLAAIELFESEKCICDGRGLRVGFYEFPENE